MSIHLWKVGFVSGIHVVFSVSEALRAAALGCVRWGRKNHCGPEGERVTEVTVCANVIPGPEGTGLASGFPWIPSLLPGILTSLHRSGGRQVMS